MAQVEAIETSLADLGYQAVRIPFTRDLGRFVRQTEEAGISMAFNLCESVDDNPQFVAHPAAVMELLNIPFTGSPAAALDVHHRQTSGKAGPAGSRPEHTESPFSFRERSMVTFSHHAVSGDSQTTVSGRQYRHRPGIGDIRPQPFWLKPCGNSMKCTDRLSLKSILTDGNSIFP